jgi:hypothetical protein
MSGFGNSKPWDSGRGGMGMNNANINFGVGSMMNNLSNQSNNMGGGMGNMGGGGNITYPLR